MTNLADINAEDLAHNILYAQERGIDRVVLHVSPALELTQGLRQRIKKASGHYTEARGYTTTRYITIPLTESKLIDHVLALQWSHAERMASMDKKGRPAKATTVVFEHGVGPHQSLPSWVKVQETKRGGLGEALAQFRLSFENAVTREVILSQTRWEEKAAAQKKANEEREAEFAREARLHNNAQEMLDLLKRIQAAAERGELPSVVTIQALVNKVEGR